MKTRWSWSLLLIATLLLAGVTLAGRAGEGREHWDDDEAVTLEGTLVEVERPLATLEVDGERYVIHLGPQWYWDREDYAIAEGDQVRVAGQVELEGETRHLYLHTLDRGEDSYRFSDDDGVPLWSRNRGRGHDSNQPARAGRGCGGCGKKAKGCCGGKSDEGAGCGKGRKNRGRRS